ncbi:penicillin-binding protein 1C [Pseudodesulfovibrio cashew]|uniref:peptidoglycan glycosyltransferase n=2 Tax=Pseudodesulfovibrio cashew TaxID=2678688 RepID=A0A6I6JNX3_9BACT|nr:penicillin-binding protein 1C [Pseudodesulfovibrio cashew]
MAALLVFMALNALFPFPEERLYPPSGMRVLDRNGTELRRFPASDTMWRFPVTLDRVSPQLIEALIESEDRWFYVHPGVNPLAVLRAAWGNLLAGRVVSGASTIPMQIARMTEPSERTLAAKLAEAFRALQLSLTHSKKELLGIYLNTAPFGGNIVGVDAASRLYFGRPPDRLSLGECALLAVLPRSPNRYDPARHPEAAMRVRDRVLKQLAERGAVDAEEARRAMRQPMVAHRRPSPMLAPHFTLLARQRLGAETELRTSLDLAAQHTVEHLLARHIARVRQQGISNGAVVVLDRRTRQVLAMAGSADFFDDQRQGQVNNGLAPRSPGSALKPFLYALAFDKGLAIPESRLLDVPTDYAGYAPENYSGTFSGQVTASEALARSLNVPAVRLLARTGLKEFHALLRTGGLETVDRPAASYGLPLVLGACEVRLVDLVNLYATLAQGGTHRPWRITPGEQKTGTPLFSTEAARSVADILTTVTRPDMPESWRLTRDRPAAAWKTGTSFGHRDAWAVGFGPTLAVGVWVGNPDGTPVKGISGATHAGPLFFDILHALESPSRDLRLPDAPDLRKVRLCAFSRMPAGPDCPETITAMAGPKMILPRCTAHKRYMADRKTGLRLQGSCLALRPAVSRVAATVPPELAAWLKAQGKPVPALPALSPACTDVPEGSGPNILSPSARTPYVMRHDAPARFQQIALRAETADPDQPLWWYVDGDFAGSAKPGAPLFLPMVPGEHAASVTDSQGRTNSVRFTVIE